MGSSQTVSIGRFAPSPTGPLHLGSLMTAVASYVDTRARGGRWLVRMEDLDERRCVRGATDRILSTLEQHGLWFDAVSYQHERIDLYQDALEDIRKLGLSFPCTCSRSRLQDAAPYPGRCRDHSGIPDIPFCIRLKVPNETIRVNDQIQGPFVQNLDTDVGDFVIYRRDGVFAYQLAVVVDDAEQRITDVIRGADLLDNTPRQLLLFRLFDAPPPRYAHLPVLSDRTGMKLSKQTRATAIDASTPTRNLTLILALLGHEPPGILRGAEPRELLAWATAHWKLSRIPHAVVHPDFVCI